MSPPAPPRSTAQRRAADLDPLEDVDRRIGPDRGGLRAWLRHMRGLLKRPLRLQRRGLQWHIVLVDRRRNPPHHGPGLARMCSELKARFVAMDREEVMRTFRQLVKVYEELRRRGWSGVEAMNSSQLARAARQAALLNHMEPAPALQRLAERLRLIQAAAEAREERARSVRRQDAESIPEVRETDFAEFTRADAVDASLSPDALAERPAAPSDAAAPVPPDSAARHPAG